MPIAILFFEEEAGWMRWSGFCLGVGGLMMLLSPWQMNWHDPKIIFGTAMLLLASLSWAISMLCARYMQWNKSPLELIPWQLLVGTLPIIWFAWSKEPIPTNVDWNVPLVLSLVYTGILVTGLSYWSGVVVNKELPTIVVSLGFLGVPVFSMLVSSYFMGETVSISTALAMGMILLGLACLVVAPTERERIDD